jgi:cytochrome P450
MTSTHNVLFLQSEVRDPYSVYEQMRRRHPVYYDAANDIRAVYRYNICANLLNGNATAIPLLDTLAMENETLHPILRNLARLSNGEQHLQARKHALDIMGNCVSIDLPSAWHYLAGEPRTPFTLDWVDAIAKKLPAFAILKGFGISAAEIEDVMPEIETIVRLMTPLHTAGDVAGVAASVKRINDTVYASISRKFGHRHKAAESLHANFIGILIQSYDAGHGLLSNSLLHYVNYPKHRLSHYNDFVPFVRESARLDPAVHNTRRVLTRNVRVDDVLLRENDHILLVLASANRDENYFLKPGQFIPSRTTSHLTFGTGIHACIAQHFAYHLAASALYYLHRKYRHIEVHENKIEYEPKVNVRLPKRITITLS